MSYRTLKLSKMDSVVVFIVLYTRHFIESMTQNTYYYMAKNKYLIQIVPHLYMNYVSGKFEVKDIFVSTLKKY